MAKGSYGRVRAKRVFQRRHLPLYVPLTLLNVTMAAWVVISWLSKAEWSVATPAYILLTTPYLVSLTLFELRWFALPVMRRPQHIPASRGWRVGVATTFVPGAEDIQMLERTVRALVTMQYPHETWVLDEGNDPDVRALCARLGAHHFTRAGAEHYQKSSGVFERRTKHGNYNAWLDAIGFERYEIICAFDPDHVPESFFLDRVLGYFDEPTVGYVQAPQCYYNQSASFVARGAAEETYAYYSSGQMRRYALGYPIVTGCHNTHRTLALREVGGFAPHEADDLLITHYYRTAGWQGIYVPEKLATGLTPTDLAGYLTQQRRWARSVLDIKLRILPKLKESLTFPERALNLVHGLNYLHGLRTALALVLLTLMLVTGAAPSALSTSTVTQLILFFLVLSLCDLFRQVFFLDPRRERGIHWRARLLRAAKWPHELLALGDALRGPRRGYTLTRKVPSGRKRYLAAPAQLLVASIVAGAWIVGAARGLDHHMALDVVTGLVVALSLAIVVSEIRDFPPPYDNELAERTRSSWTDSDRLSAGSIREAI